MLRCLCTHQLEVEQIRFQSSRAWAWTANNGGEAGEESGLINPLSSLAEAYEIVDMTVVLHKGQPRQSCRPSSLRFPARALTIDTLRY